MWQGRKGVKAENEKQARVEGPQRQMHMPDPTIFWPTFSLDMPAM